MSKSTLTPESQAVIKRHNKVLIGAIVQILFTFVLGDILPTFGSVTRMGVQAICTFFGILFSLNYCNETLWTGLIGILGLIWCGYFKDGAAAAAGTIGGTTVFQLIFMSALAYAINISGAGEVISNKFLRLKFVQGRPILMSLTVIVAFWIGGNFMGGFALLFIAFPILDNMLDQAGIERAGTYGNLMRLGIYLACFAGGSMKDPITSYCIQRMDMFDTALSGAGLPLVDRGQYVWLAFIIMAVIFVSLPLSFKFVFRCDMTNLKNSNFREMEGMEAKQFTKQQIILIIGFFAYALYNSICKLFPADSVAYAKISSLGLHAWGCVIVVLLTLIRADHKPVFDIKDCFQKGVDWGLCFVMAFFSTFGGCLASPDSGIQTWLADTLGPVFDGKPVIFMVFLFVLLTTVVTNFFSNIATGTIFAAIASVVILPNVAAGTVNPTVMVLLCNYCSMFAFMTYAACGAAPILHAQKGFDAKFVWSKGLGVTGLYIVLCTVVFTVMNMVL